MNNNWGPTVFNTWVGDPVRLVVLDAILDTVAEDNLCDNATQTGDYIQSELRVSKSKLNLLRFLILIIRKSPIKLEIS